ncbi:MAG: alpha/beta hydrolase [Chlorobi bacterium]|nr:alpha/beta hydrolase [Chlorobiota bacterium]
METLKNEGFQLEKLKLKDDYEGRVEATLFKRNAKTVTKKAILYIHGFVDYFFQVPLADWANQLGFNFYALELRKYGRSMLDHQKPNMFRHYSEYFEEINEAVKVIKEKDKNKTLILMGHSTGGLLSSLYAHHYRQEQVINGLILNSPFFDFNLPAIKKLVVPVMAAFGRVKPEAISPEGLKKGYPESLHKDYYGEWDFDERYKPIKGFPINFGWINGIYQAQKKLQKGLDIQCPVLVMFSTTSVKPGKYREEMKTADAVLNVKDIEKYADGLGKNVKKAAIEDGVHDLILSRKDVREKVYQTMESFLRENGFIQAG